jgi:plasmid maintenance system antidote protein VapI
MAQGDESMTISDQLRSAIRSYGTGTAYAASKASGVAVDSIQRFLDGDRDLRLESAARLCEALGLELRATIGNAKKAARKP